MTKFAQGISTNVNGRFIRRWKPKIVPPPNVLSRIYHQWQVKSITNLE
jgi:hypothetical protein